ncbi:MAG: type II toxin-antitoxin system HicB family antitoxin [Desulfurococcales archaeon]|nr:type II toxin-antitoxin system HicB family antitoxin [Desulfurococcales archaeon]
MNRRVREFSVVILEDEDGGYIAVVPELPGCHTQGDSLDEVIENAKEAIELYLETLPEEEKEELLRRRVVGLQRVKAVA